MAGAVVPVKGASFIVRLFAGASEEFSSGAGWRVSFCALLVCALRPAVKSRALNMASSLFIVVII